MICRFCGGDADAPTPLLHLTVCCGQQGHVEARALYGAMGDVPYETGSATSAAAAHALADRSTLEARVYAVLRRQPATCDEVEALTGLPHQTVSARIRGLVLRDHVGDSGTRRKTRQQRDAVVWKVLHDVA